MPFITRLPALTGADPYPDALLALDFVGARRGPQYYKALGVTTADITKIPGWTYTGGTPAGVGSYAARQDGSLQFFPSYTNLLTYSEQFDNAAWSKNNGSSVAANSVTAPDGTTTADTLTFSADGISRLERIAVSGATGTYTFSVWAKTASGTFDFRIRAGTGATQVVTATTTWQRFQVTETLAAVNSQPVIMNNASAGVGSIYIWGAQLELGSTASTYIPTTTAAVTVGTPRITDAGYDAWESRTNLLTYSQQFDNAAWSKIATTVTANQAIAPDGTLTADAMAETATTAQHYMLQGVTKAASPATYTASWYVKQFGTARNAKLSITDGAGAGADYTVNPVTGAVLSGPTYYGGVPFSAASIVVTQVANGFAKIDMTATTNSTAVVVALIQTTSGTTLSFLGDTGTGFYIWQADLQAGSFATSPIPTTSVAVTRAADVGYVSGLVVPSAVTLRADFSRTAAAASNFGSAASINGGSAANEIYFTRNSSTSVKGYSTAASSAKEIMSATVSSGVDAVSAAVRSAALNGGGAVNGVLATGPDVSTVVVPSSLTILSVGSRSNGATPNNGPIRRIVIYPRAFGNAELQAITTAGAY